MSQLGIVGRRGFPHLPQLHREQLAALNGTRDSNRDSLMYKFRPDATIEQLQVLPFQIHEAPCYIPEKSQLFSVEWGAPGGRNSEHDYQYLLDLKTSNLTTIRTNPPTRNLHGCVYCKGRLHVVADGGPHETEYLATIDPATWERTTILNNLEEQPFISLNDLDMDREGNYYMTNSLSGWGQYLHPCGAPTAPTVYFVNTTTMRIKTLLYLQNGNTSGVAVSADGGLLGTGRPVE
ncbi:hypothetical protein PG997_008047 [Apiospora hydei]|uniref:SMP-30/Gluconolactonase/LRE-like region domain-containing protein n=1 Tax=Apiospora hydei TaxID=1337664 RepID=A0ABR1W9Q4_9PEZI